MRFLIVDDSRAIQTIVRRALEKLGMPDVEYRAAADGHEALPIIENWMPDLVLTDWHMPGMTGIELLRLLRQRNDSDLKVGFITTESDVANLDEARRLGALFCINKPFEDEELVGAVRAALKMSGARKPGADIKVIPLGLDAVTGLMATLLAGKLAVAMLPKASADEIHLPSAVGLYALEGSGEIRAMCLLDRLAMLLVGGTAAGMALPELERLMDLKDVPPDIWNPMLKLVEGELPGLFSCSDSKLKSVRTQLLKHQPAQLRDVMARSPYRSDFSLVRSRLPAGQLTLISK